MFWSVFCNFRKLLLLLIAIVVVVVYIFSTSNLQQKFSYIYRHNLKFGRHEASFISNVSEIEDKEESFISTFSETEDQEASLMSTFSETEDQEGSFISNVSNIKNQETLFISNLPKVENQEASNISNLSKIEKHETSLISNFPETEDQEALFVSNCSKTDDRPHNLLNLTDFHYLINTKTICDCTSDDSTLITFIHSARYNSEYRQVIRDTWGSVKNYKNWTVKTIFLLGAAGFDTEPEEFAQRIYNESNQYGDIVMGNFIDTYRNLSYKHIMGYKWILQNCANAKYVMKADDDIFIDVFKVIDIVILHQLKYTHTVYACYTFSGTEPIRDPLGETRKWYVSQDEFSGKFYPDYCSGSTYLMSMTGLKGAYGVSDKVKFLWVDDAFVTGVVRQAYENRQNILHSHSILDITQLPNLKYSYDLSNEYSRLVNLMKCEESRIARFPLAVYILMARDVFETHAKCLWDIVVRKTQNMYTSGNFYHLFG